MLMRPATPLSVLFLVAFALLLLSTISTPVIKGIPLASWKGTDFGVFGYCTGGNCSNIEIGYDTVALSRTKLDFSLPEGTRHSVSYILVIHPVAALLTLICFALAVAAHFHSPAHSPRFLLGLFILTIPTLLASLLAFLVDILLFIPHVSWGGWIVLAATIIIIIASLVTCGMRRTLVSRKARRKRIQENAEMNGQNYFESLAAKQQTQPQVESLPRAESPPPLSGGSTVPLTDKSSYATYEARQVPSNEDRIPLSQNTAPPAMNGGMQSGYNDPARSRSRSQPRNVDEYGNPIVAPMGMRRPSTESNRSDRPYYARGGRGGYPPNRGGYPGRGGPPPMRGGPQGGRGPSPGGYRGRGGPGMPPPGMMLGRGAPPPGPGNYGPPPNYPPQDRYGPSPYGQPTPYQDVRPPGPAMAPPPIGQAVEMDGTMGIPSPAQSPALPDNEFVPARAQWNQRPSPPITANGNRALSPIQASPVNNPPQYNRHTRTESGSYYEDVDPRFAEAPAPLAPSTSNPQTMTASSEAIPAALMAGGPGPTAEYRGGPPPSMPMASNATIDSLRQESQESLQEGQRSPATSDTSHFTSVSQRGINPNWRPPPPGSMPPPRGLPSRPRPSDVLLNSNPDFALPGMARGRGGGGGAGAPGGRMGPGRQSPAMNMGLGQPSRYPGV